MKVLLICIGTAVVVASFVADYLWRKWIAERKRERQ
jgi:hypothetical protein